MLPKHFRRWVSTEAAPSFTEAARLRRLEMTHPKPDEVLVRTMYATINAGHQQFHARREGYFKDLTGVQNLGADGLGQIVEVGAEVSSLKVGDYVTCTFCNSFSEYVTPREWRCLKIDKPNPDYAALRMSGTFVSCALESIAKIEEGKSLLVTAACGGLGHIAVQFGKLNGCHVIGTCGNAEKKKKLLELGVDRVINYNAESVAEVLENEYPFGVDYVLDGVGGDVGRTAFENLAPRGKLLIVGFFADYPHTGRYDTAKNNSLAEGMPPTVDLFWQLQDTMVGDKQIIARTWPRDTEEIIRCRDRAHSLYKEGKIKVLVDTYALEHFVGIENVVEATDYMLSGKNVGKMLIKI